MMDWTGAVAFVTGGAQGIGLGIARSLVQRHARVAIVDIDAAALASAQADLTARGGTVRSYLLDVRDREAYAAVAERAESDLGEVSLLFNNAGIAPALTLGELTYAAWDLAMEVNVGGVVNGIQTFMPRFIERGTGGYIVNTASGAGFINTTGILYTTTKHAVVALSEAVKREAVAYGVDVSVLCPATVATNIMKNTGTVAGSLRMLPDDLAATEASLEAGLSIDEVGEIVMAGMERKATWIHTSGDIREPAAERFEAILASFPEAG